MSIVKLIADGRLIKDPVSRSYGESSLATFTIACDTGWGDKKKTLFFNCTAFGKTGEAIVKFLKKGDSIFIAGTPTQNKKDDKVYHGVIVNEWSFGAKKRTNADGGSHDNDVNDSPFSDDDIPF